MNPVFVALPTRLVTATLPVAPPLGVAVMVVAFNLVKLPAAIPPKLTPVMSAKLDPVIVTSCPW